MPTSFVTEHLGRRHADMLWRIRTFDETWLHLLVLFEFQSTVDRRMAFRMMNYAGGIWMGLNSDHLGLGGVFPLVLPVVVYSGRRRWTAPRDIRDLLTPAPHGLLGSRPRHPYLLIELQRLGPPPLPEENVLSMIAALERARSPKRLEELALALRDWVEHAGAEELLDRFREWISQVLAQRHGPEGRALELRIRNQEEARMTTLIERARQWGEELNQEWLERGSRRAVWKGSGSWSADSSLADSVRGPRRTSFRCLRASRTRIAWPRSPPTRSHARRPGSWSNGHAGMGRRSDRRIWTSAESSPARLILARSTFSPVLPSPLAAKRIFEGPVATLPDRRRYYGEDRNISIGRVEPEALIVVAHTEHHGLIRLDLRPPRIAQGKEGLP